MELSKIFVGILNMSLTASYCIAAVIVIRFLLRRQPKLFSYILWSVVLFRMLCPFSISSSYSLLRINTDIISQENISGTAYGNNTYGQNAAGSGMAPEITANTNTDEVEKSDLGIKYIGESEDLSAKRQIFAKALPIIAVVWIAGIVILALYNIMMTMRMRGSLSGAVRVEDNVYEVENITTPFVFGIIKPGIYLPAGITGDERRYVLTHEKVHIARKDYLIKILAYAGVCIHWFNPLVWLAFALMEKDMEMSCDEAVIKKLGEDIKKAYSNSLLALSCEDKTFQNNALAFGEKNIKERILNILSYKKRTLLTVALAAAVVIIIGAGLALNPDKKAEAADMEHTGDIENEVDTANAEDTENARDTESEVDIANARDTENEVDTANARDAENGEYTANTGDAAQFIEKYANAVMERDGTAVAEAYVDEEHAITYEENMLLEKAGGSYTYGYSSPWPIEFRYAVFPEEQKADIYYYAWTSDPHITVWKQEIEYIKVGEDYRIERSSMKFLDDISSKEEFDEAYVINGENCFIDYVEIGFVEGINYQIENDNSYTDNVVYESPETAAAYILNLTGGEGRVEGDYSSQAMVRYTFADGSEVMIPMYNANAFAQDSEDGSAGGGDTQGAGDVRYAGNAQSAGNVPAALWVVDVDVWNAKAP